MIFGVTNLGSYTQDKMIRHSGVGFLKNKQCGKNLMSYYQCTNRIIMIKINIYPTITTIIQVYMPTTTHDDDEVEEVYDKLNEVLSMTRTEEYVIILNDWNSSIGQQNDGYMVGIYGLGEKMKEVKDLHNSARNINSC